MNSRFKFRAWNKKDKTLHYGAENTYDYLGGRPKIFEETFGVLLSKTDEWEVEQCTGLKDKNGKLIYENDRVGFYVYGQDEEWHAQQGTVIWYNSCWGIETSSRFIQFENEFTIKNPKDIKIIGNIHEQAEQKDNK